MGKTWQTNPPWLISQKGDRVSATDTSFTKGGRAMRILRFWVGAVALVLLTAPIWLPGPAGGQGKGIQWETNFDEALARAKAEDKPVFLDFFNPN